MANSPPNFSLTDPIDLETGIRSIGDEETFYNMMEGFDDMTLIETLTKMKEHVQAQDFPKLRDAAHSLKGASGYLAAGRIFKLCETIHKHIDVKNYDSAIRLYPEFIVECITLRLYIKKLLYKRKNIQYTEGPQDYEIPIANGYKVFTGNDGKIVVKLVDEKPQMETATISPREANTKFAEESQPVNEKKEIKQVLNTDEPIHIHKTGCCVAGCILF